MPRLGIAGNTPPIDGTPTADAPKRKEPQRAAQLNRGSKSAMARRECDGLGSYTYIGRIR